MDETDDDANRYYDRHAGSPYAEPGGAGCLDMLVLIWPIVFVVLALAIGTPLAIAVTSDTTSGARFAAFTALYGGLAAAYLTVIWGAAYLAARAVSLWIGARRVLWIGFAGILMSVLVVAAGVIEWASLLIAIPSLSVMISAAVKMRSEP